MDYSTSDCVPQTRRDCACFGFQIRSRLARSAQVDSLHQMKSDERAAIARCLHCLEM